MSPGQKPESCISGASLGHGPISGAGLAVINRVHGKVNRPRGRGDMRGRMASREEVSQESPLGHHWESEPLAGVYTWKYWYVYAIYVRGDSNIEFVSQGILV